MLKDLTRRALYASGLMGLWHRLRNADSLTVLMFHRTLSPDDPRTSSSDPDYTLPADVFARTLRFFSRHYNVVSQAQVLDARRGGARLPPRALLITFDDGWSDNVDHALPALQASGLPGLMFVVADAVGERQPFFQERLVSGWRRGRLRVGELVSRIGSGEAQGAKENSVDALRATIRRLEDMPSAERDALLAPLEPVIDDGLRHMVTVDELQRLHVGGVALGLHGKTHVPMTRATDLDAELAGARAALLATLPAGADDGTIGRTMSFPHGAHDAAIAARAHEAGYELVFTSVPVLNPVGARLGWLLGRTGFETDTVVDAHGRFRPDWLAWYLFRRESRRLAA